MESAFRLSTSRMTVIIAAGAKVDTKDVKKPNQHRWKARLQGSGWGEGRPWGAAWCVAAQVHTTECTYCSVDDN